MNFRWFIGDLISGQVHHGVKENDKNSEMFFEHLCNRTSSSSSEESLRMKKLELRIASAYKGACESQVVTSKM